MLSPAPEPHLAAGCAFDFFPSSFSTAGESLMGINAANEGFLRAFLRHGQQNPCIAHVRDAREARVFAGLVAEVCGPERPASCLRPDDLGALARVGALLHPFPGFSPLAWTRNFGPPVAYSLLGITHTTATQAVMDSIGALSTAPIHPWDAVVCTSSAVRHTYDTVLDQWEEHLRQRLGARRLPRPQLPIIPLGVDTDRIRPASAEERQRRRQELAIPPEAFVVLWVGRFHHAQKAHPVPALLALEQLAQALDRPVVYLQSGWFANPAIEEAFSKAARRCAPSVTQVVVDGREEATRRQVWHAADVFLSLSDNLQETFGLTPIEAMAAELPVVVSDWDGYRDTVRDGVDGYRIPTSMPAPGLGGELALGYCSQTLSYGPYCGVSCQSVAADVDYTARVLQQLAADPSLCRRLGAAGRQRALQRFEWAVVIQQYRELLVELAGHRDAARRRDPALASTPALMAPLRADPYRIFSSYPTHQLGLASALRLTPAWQAAGAGPSPEQRQWLQELHNDPLFHFGAAWRLPLSETAQLLTLLARQPGLSIQEIAAPLGIESVAGGISRLVATAGWLQKLGVLALG